MKPSNLILLACITICSCEEINVVPAPSVFRTWTEIEPAGVTQFAGSNIISLALNPDSTYQVTYNLWNDIRIPGDPCHNVSYYYAKGRYTTTRDSLFFVGCSSDANCAACIARCDGSMDYKEKCSFKITRDTLYMNADQDWASSRVMVRSTR